MLDGEHEQPARHERAVYLADEVTTVGQVVQRERAVRDLEHAGGQLDLVEVLSFGT